MTTPDSGKAKRLHFLTQWFDSSAVRKDVDQEEVRVEWLRNSPFLVFHLMCFAVIWVGFSWVACLTALFLYVTRMFFITAFFHRYFSHRAFKTSRAFQFIMGWLACTSSQRGPLWWAAHHRHHHKHSDMVEDSHSPRQSGFLWSHTLWFLTNKAFGTRMEYVGDFAKYPEIRWLDRFDWIPVVTLAVLLYIFGAVLESAFPALGTSGFQMLVWGFFVSTVVLYHATYTINSLAHRFGSQRYATGDDSRNNFWLAILTLGEGWHNNHHHFPASAKQGFYWWEIDISYYVLVAMQKLGLIWDLRGVSENARNRNRVEQETATEDESPADDIRVKDKPVKDIASVSTPQAADLTESGVTG